MTAKEMAISAYNKRKTPAAADTTKKAQAIAAYDKKKTAAKRAQNVTAVASRPAQYKSEIPAQYKDILNAQDFDKYSQIGANLINPTYDEARGDAVVFGQYINAKKVENAVNFVKDEENAVKLAFGAVPGVDINYKHITDEEASVYNYLLGSGRTDEAQKYLDDMKDVLEQRAGAMIAENNSDFFGKLLVAGGAGIEQAARGIRNIGSLVTGDEGEGATAMDYAYSALRDDSNWLEALAMDVTQTGTNMLPSILIGASINPIVGSITLGASAAGNGYAEMRKLGYDANQSRTYGTLVGASEALLQSLLGGISALGGKVGTKALTKLLGGIDNSFGRFAAKFGNTAAGQVIMSVGAEALEEGLQTAIEPVLQTIATGELADAAEISDIAYSALLGAIMGGIFETPTTVINNRRAKRAYRDLGERITNVEQNESDLITAAKNSEIDELVRLAEKTEQTSKESKRFELLGKLATEVETEAERRNTEKYKEILTPEEAMRLGGNPIEYFSDENITAFDEAIDDYAYKRKYTKYQETADAANVAKIIFANDKAENLKRRYEGTLGKLFDLEIDKDKNKALQIAVDVETLRLLGIRSNGKTVEKMISTLPKAERERILALPTELIASAFEDGVSVANAESAKVEERKKADEIKKEREAQRAETETETETETEAEPASETEGEANFIISSAIRTENLTEKQSTAVEKIRTLAKLLPGFNFVIDTPSALPFGANGRYDPTTNTIHVNVEAGKNSTIFDYALESALTHEVLHTIRENSPTSYEELKSFLRANYYTEAQWNAAVKARQEQYSDVIENVSFEYAEEEVVANSLGKVLTSQRVMNQLGAEKPNLLKRIIAAVKRFFARFRYQSLDRSYKTPEERIVAAQLGSKAKKLEDMFANAVKTANLNAESSKVLRDANRAETATAAENDPSTAEEVPFSNPEEAKMSGEISDSRFSLQFAPKIAEKQRKYIADKKTALTATELESAIEQTDEMVEIMSPYKDILPEDKPDKTLVKNGSYDISVENTTICIRTLAYNVFVDMVSERIGRPLSQMESFLVSQKLYEIAKEPQCLYCYVSLDRKAFNEMILRYVEQRDAAVAAYEAAGRPALTEKFRQSDLYRDFLRDASGKVRKNTDEMWSRYKMWMATTKDQLLTLNEIATEAQRSDIANEDSGRGEQIRDMLAYAQSASWAKKQTQYVAYYNDILNLGPRTISNLNKHYGLRFYSFSDYSGAFIVENMQQITDAAIRGLKGLAYTKDTDFAKIFAPSGININISVYVNKDADGKYYVDEKQSANLKEAIDLRKQYPNVGIVAVATDREGVEWALAQNWSDVVIPFHTVRTGRQVAEYYDWTVFNAEQNDVVADKNLWNAYLDTIAKGKSEETRSKISKMVYPSDHQNDLQTYLRITKERGLTPRFSSFLSNPNYMKLVNETRQSDAQTAPMKPIFDLDAAKASFKKFVDKGGYYEGWYNDGIDVDGEADIVAADIAAGKKPNEVDYAIAGLDPYGMIKNRKNNRQHGQKLSLRDKLNREALAGAFAQLAENDTERDIVNRYIAELDNIDARIDDRRAKIERLEEIKGIKGMGGERARLKAQITDAENYITRHDEKLLKLATAKPFADLVERYREKTNRAINTNQRAYAVTMSRGAFNQAVANYTKDKMYSLGDAEKALSNTAEVQMLTLKTRDQIYHELWEGLNALNTSDEKKQFAESMSTRVLEAIEQEAEKQNPDFVPSRELLGYFKDYIQRLEFDEKLKEEIVHKWDKIGSKSIFARWSNKHPDKPAIPVDEFVTAFARENPGYEYLEEMATIDALEILNDLYVRTRDTTPYTLAFAEPDGAELATIKNEIRDQILEAFSTGGRETIRSKMQNAEMEALENKNFKLRERFDNMMEQNKARLELDRVARMIREKKLGTFENATQVQGDAVAGLLRDLASFEYRRTFSVSDVRKKVGKLIDWYTKEQPLLDYVDAQNPGLYSEYIESSIKSLAGGKGAMTAAEFYELADVLKHLLHVAESFNKVWYHGKWIDAIDEALRFIQKLQLTAQREKQHGKFVTALSKISSIYLDEFQDPHSVAVMHDRAVEDGFFTSIIEMLQDCETDLVTAYNDATSPYFNFFERNPDYARKAQLESVSIFGKRVPKLAAISLWMTLKQPDAHRGFIESGFDFYNAEGKLTHARSAATEAAIAFKRDIVKKEAIQNGLSEQDATFTAEAAVSEGYKNDLLTKDELEAFVKPYRDSIEKSFTAKDRELISILENGFNNVFREKKRKTDTDRMGFSNVREGYYFPISRVTKEKLEDQGYADELQSVSNISANKERVFGAAQTLMIRNVLSVYEKHAKAITTYENIQPFVDYYQKVYNINAFEGENATKNNDPTNVKKFANEVWGKSEKGKNLIDRSFDRYIKNLLQDVQGLRQERTNPFSTMIASLRGASARASLSINAKVLMSQLSSLGASFHILTGENLRKGIKSSFGEAGYGTALLTKEGRTKLQKLGAIVDEYCPLAKARHANNTIYLAQGVIEKDGVATPKGKALDKIRQISDKLMEPISAMDRAVVCTLFEACKYESATASAPYGSKENLKAAGDLLTDVIRLTQQTTLATNKSAAMRSPSEILKTLTMFTSDSMRTASRLIEAVATVGHLSAAAKTAKGKEAEILQRQLNAAKHQLGKSTAVLTATAAYIAAITLVFRAIRGKIEDDENLLLTVGGDVFFGFFAGLPGVTDVVERLLGTRYYDITDAGLSSFYQLIANLGKIHTTTKAVLFGEKDVGALFGALKNLATTVGQVLGIPVRNVWNFIYGTVKNINKDAAKSIDRFLK